MGERAAANIRAEIEGEADASELGIDGLTGRISYAEERAEAAEALRYGRGLGYETIAVRGELRLNGRRVNACTVGNRIIFRVDAVNRRGRSVEALRLVKHEIFHHAAQTDKGLYAAARALVRENMSEAEFARLREVYKAAYSTIKDFSGMTEEEIADYIESELCADAYAGLNAFAGDGELGAQMNTLMESNQEAQRAEAGRGTRGPPQAELNVEFENELDSWIEATSEEERLRDGGRFLIGTTSEKLKQAQVDDYKIYFGKSKIAKIMQNPEMTKEVIKQAVRVVENPIIVMDSETVEGSIVMFGEAQTDNGKPVMVSLLLHPESRTGEVLDYGVITSTYGRRTSNAQNLINRSTVRYVETDKNRTEQWSKALGLHLPSASTTVGSDNMITPTESKSNSAFEPRASMDFDDPLNTANMVENIWELQEEGSAEISTGDGGTSILTLTKQADGTWSVETKRDGRTIFTMDGFNNSYTAAYSAVYENIERYMGEIPQGFRDYEGERARMRERLQEEAPPERETQTAENPESEEEFNRRMALQEETETIEYRERRRTEAVEKLTNGENAVFMTADGWVRIQLRIGANGLFTGVIRNEAGTWEDTQWYESREAAAESAVECALSGKGMELLQERRKRRGGDSPSQSRKLDSSPQGANQEAGTESTAVNTDPDAHTAEEQRIIEEYRGAADESLAEFYQKALADRTKNSKFALKEVSERIIGDIKRLLGRDVSGYKTVFEARQAWHIDKDHGVNGKTDHSMADVNDVARIQYVLDNYDTVEPGGTTTAYVTVKPNGKHGNAKTLLFSKKVNGTYYVVEAVPDTTKNTVYIVSAFMQNKKTGSPSVDAEAPRFTPEAAAANPVRTSINEDGAQSQEGDMETDTAEEQRAEEQEHRQRQEQYMEELAELVDEWTENDPAYRALFGEEAEAPQTAAPTASPQGASQAGTAENPNGNPNENPDGNGEGVDPRTLVRTVAEAEEEPGFKEWLRSKYHLFQRLFTHDGETIARIEKKTGEEGLEGYYFRARAAVAAAETMVTQCAVDIRGERTGKSLNEILKPIRQKGAQYYEDFQLYLYHMHNIDRMSRDFTAELNEAKARIDECLQQWPALGSMAKEEISALVDGCGPGAETAEQYLQALNDRDSAARKHPAPVFGYEVTADISREAARQLLAEHPEFREYAEEVYDYADNLLRYRVEAGLITQEHMDNCKKLYPHYVPTFRTDGKRAARRTAARGGIRVSKVLGHATGGESAILPIHQALAQQSVRVCKQGAVNMLGMRLLAARDGDQSLNEFMPEVVQSKYTWDPDTGDTMDAERLFGDRKTFTFYDHGQAYTMSVDEGLSWAIKSAVGEMVPRDVWTAFTPTRAAVSLIKKLNTEYVPSFFVTNQIRDAQEAVFYSADLNAWRRNYTKAWGEIINGGSIWTMYQAIGGKMGSIMNTRTGEVTDTERNLAAKAVHGLELGQEAAEAVPRLAEFMTILQKAEKKTERETLNGKTVPLRGEAEKKGELYATDVRSAEPGNPAADTAAFLQSKEAEFIYRYPTENRDTEAHIFILPRTMQQSFGGEGAGTAEQLNILKNAHNLLTNAVLTHAETAEGQTVYTFLAAVQTARGAEPVRLTVKAYENERAAKSERISEIAEKQRAAGAENHLTDGKILVLESIEQDRCYAAEVKGGEGATIKPRELMALVRGAAQQYLPKTTNADMDTLMKAYLAAQEITTNFNRGGTATRFLNTNLVPFLNAGVQGLSKATRTVTESRSARQWAGLVLKTAALGWTPAIINALFYWDDDEWDEMPDEAKINNYLFKLGNGRWIKIPKGRVLAFLSEPAVYAAEKQRGDETKLKEYTDAAKTAMLPTGVIQGNVVTAWQETKLFDPTDPGETWYGGDIESQRLQGYAPGERYDSSTDAMSKWLGGALNLSPKKINYLLNQYGGVISDIVLPFLTPQAEQNPIERRFTLDTTRTNKASSRYYDLQDELKWAENGGDTAAGLARSYMNHANREISEAWAALREIEADTTLTDKEKKPLIREMKKAVNTKMLEIEAQAREYREKGGKWLEEHSELNYEDEDAVARWTREYNEGVSEEKEEISEEKAAVRMESIAERELNREILGAEYALECYGESVYERATELESESGVSYDTYYDFYFGTKDLQADRDEDGKAIDGSRKHKVADFIEEMDIPPEQKAALYASAGFKDMWKGEYLKKNPELDYRDAATVREWMRGYNEAQSEDKYRIDAEEAARRMESIADREARREAEGAKEALEVYSDYVYDKAEELHEKNGIAYDTYYDYYFGTQSLYADKDEDGKSISGSKKEKVVSFIDKMDIPKEQKDALYIAAGYTEKSLNTTPWNGGSGKYAKGSSRRGGGGRGRSSAAGKLKDFDDLKSTGKAKGFESLKSLGTPKAGKSKARTPEAPELPKPDNSYFYKRMEKYMERYGVRV